MKNTLILCLIFSALFIPSCKKENPVNPTPEYYSINGTVAEVNDTLDVIRGAILKVNDMADTTDENGNFNFEQVLSGKAVISITHPDYNSCDTTFNFNSNIRFMPLLSRSHPDYFPNEPGNYWKYEVIDSVLKTRYVYTLKIIKDTVTKDGRFKIWEYFNRSNENEYTRYLVQIKDDKVFEHGEVQYILPIEVGQKWSIAGSDISVLKQEPIVTYAGTFDNCFKLQLSFTMEHSHGYCHKWFAPGVGWVKKRIIDTGWRRQNETITLLEYKVK